MKTGLFFGLLAAGTLAASFAFASPTTGSTPTVAPVLTAKAWTPAGYGVVTSNSGRNPGVIARSALVVRQASGQRDVSQIRAVFRPNGDPAMQRHDYIQPSTNGQHYNRVVDYHYSGGLLRRQTERLFKRDPHSGGHELVYTHRFDFNKQGAVTRSRMTQGPALKR